jgi:uncharacterized damage-inducible protein DinB
VREVERLAGLMRAAFGGDPWHGPSVLACLAGLDAAGAAARPVPGAMSVWELVAHLADTQTVLLRRLAGEPVSSPDGAFPPQPEPTEANWQALLATLRRQEDELIAAVAALPDAKLLEPLPGSSPAYVNLVGHLQHHAYHAGQIRLLRKLLGR